MIISSGDKLYVVKRKIRINRFSDLEQVKQYRDLIKCDHVLSSNEHYIFCLTIDDIEEIEEIKSGDLV
jgi:hypothetical protein